MKTFLPFLVLISLLSLSASADLKLDQPSLGHGKMLCRDDSKETPSVYEVLLLIKPDHSAVAKVHSDKSGVLLARLNCTKITSDSPGTYGGQPILSCAEPGLADAGYSLILVEDPSGKQEVTLSTVSFTGTKVLAKLPCRNIDK
jgi:hypothetical protein